MSAETTPLEPQPQPIELQHQGITDLFMQAPLYVECVRVQAVTFTRNLLSIETRWRGGKLEQEARPAAAGDWLVITPRGERHIVSPEGFARYYHPTGAPRQYEAYTRVVRAFSNPTGGPVACTMTNGEVIIGQPGCMFVMAVAVRRPDQPTGIRYFVDDFDGTHVPYEQVFGAPGKQLRAAAHAARLLRGPVAGVRRLLTSASGLLH